MFAQQPRPRLAPELTAAAFGSCGSLRYRDQAERELRKLGHHVYWRTRPGTTDGAGVESLTEPELRAARLVADRKTNPQISAELSLRCRHRGPVPHPGRFAACNGTAPAEVSSGEKKIYRLSLRGNCRLNHAIHMAAITQISHTHSQGRAYCRGSSPRARPTRKRCAA